MRRLRLLALVLTLGAVTAACDATDLTSVREECPMIGSGAAGCL